MSNQSGSKQASIGNMEAPKAATVEERLAALEAREKDLLARESQVQKREEDAKRAEDSNAARPVRGDGKAFIGDGYEFQVEGVNPKHNLPVKKITACDESEAIRVYILTTNDPIKTGKQVDTVAYPVKATCLSRKREESIKYQKMVAAIRSKDERGQSLTEQERTILDNEAAKLG
jgi:hypothetical protein